MALINNIYIHVTDEEINRESTISSHSVEEGIDITDHIKVEPVEVSLEGKLVNYSATVAQSSSSTPSGIKVWISLVKRDSTAFDSMSFERLNNEIIAFENGVSWINTGEIQYFDMTGNPVDISTNSNKVIQVKFQVKMPYEGKVRIQNDYTEFCAFNIINKSSTGYNIQDYNADEPVSDIVFSNTYNGQTGRVRTEFTNYDDPAVNNPSPTVERSAAWVLQQLVTFWKTGALITYEGRNYLQNFQIKSFPTTHPKTNAGGADFTMTLIECRTAVNSYGVSDSAIQNGSTQQIEQGDNSEVWYTVQIGDSVFGLVAADDAPYKNLKRTTDDGISHSAMEWVMMVNPSAFDTYGDYTTLKAGVKILLGTR